MADFHDSDLGCSLAEAARRLALPEERLGDLVRDGGLSVPGPSLAHGDFRLRRADVARLHASCHPGMHHHAVQFFDTEDFLGDAVSNYLAEGLEVGAPLVVIARPERRALFVQQMRGAGCDTARAIEQGQLQLFDAQDTLDRFMVQGMPDGERFRAAIAPVIQRGRAGFAGARLRAYGEMVDILWAQGRPHAALQLEALWNELATEHPFSLLCGYCMDRFRGPEDEALFEQVCTSHTEVSPAESCAHPGHLDAHRREVARMQQRIRALEARLVIGEATQAQAAVESPASQPADAALDTAPPMTVLIVDDAAAARRLLIEALREIRRPRMRLIEADGVATALEAIDRDAPDLCFCDFRLSRQETALDLFHATRERGHLLPFVGVTSNLLEEELARTLLTVGFEDVLLKRDAQSGNLARVIRNAALRSQNTRRLVEAGTVDEMTGALNRRGFMARIESEWQGCARAGQALSLLYLDLNNLKRVNDRHGHSAGDRIIVELVGALRSLLRPFDAVGRLGGDEFCVALPGADEDVAQAVAARLHERLATTTLEIGDERVVPSVSVGLCTARAGDGVDPEEILRRADAEMFEDKRRSKVGRSDPR